MNATFDEKLSNESNDWSWTKLLLVNLFCLLIIIIIIGNTLVILSVITTRRLRTVTNLFVTNLAVADWMVGFLVSHLDSQINHLWLVQITFLYHRSCHRLLSNFQWVSILNSMKLYETWYMHIRSLKTLFKYLLPFWNQVLGN